MNAAGRMFRWGKTATRLTASRACSNVHDLSMTSGCGQARSLQPRPQPDTLQEQRYQFALPAHAGLGKNIPQMHARGGAADAEFIAAFLESQTFHQKICKVRFSGSEPVKLPQFGLGCLYRECGVQDHHKDRGFISNL